MRNKKVVLIGGISLLIVCIVGIFVILGVINSGKKVTVSNIQNFTTSLFVRKSTEISSNEDGITITVEKGDTIESIATKYHGDVQEIEDFNLLDYPFVLTEGQKLFIPNGSF